MALPVVAIVGRPNVGKSSLLNMLAGRRVSIVAPTPGVTRDRVSAVCEIDDRFIEVIDTGGYGVEDRDDLTQHIEAQIELAVSGAMLILFVVDVLAEVTPLDQEVARLLRGAAAPVQLVANKADVEAHNALAGPLTALGFGEALCVSALHGRGRRALMERLAAAVGDAAGAEAPDPVMQVTIIGRRNVGKSTLINALAGQERVIVSETPGTTRDAIDVRFELDGREFVAIDTAGVGRKTRHRDPIEFYGYTRVLASVRRADVVLFMLDSTSAITDVDKKLARLIVDESKPCVIVVNKWDLAKGRASAEDYGAYLTRTLPHLDHAPLAFTTAAAGRNVRAAVELAQTLFKQASARVTTGQLNRAIEATMAAYQPSADRRGAQPKIYYATQISVRPPTVVLFVNNPAIVREQYRRFAEKRIRESLPFPEVPVRFIWRARQEVRGRSGQRKASAANAPAFEGDRSARGRRGRGQRGADKRNDEKRGAPSPPRNRRGV